MAGIDAGNALTITPQKSCQASSSAWLPTATVASVGPSLPILKSSLCQSSPTSPSSPIERFALRSISFSPVFTAVNAVVSLPGVLVYAFTNLNTVCTAASHIFKSLLFLSGFSISSSHWCLYCPTNAAAASLAAVAHAAAPAAVFPSSSELFAHHRHAFPTSLDLMAR